MGSPANSKVNHHPSLGPLRIKPSGRAESDTLVAFSRRLGVQAGQVYHERFSTNNLPRRLDGGRPHESMPPVRVRQAPAGLNLFNGSDSSGRRHLCLVSVPTGVEPGVAQPPMAPDTTRPQISTQLPAIRDGSGQCRNIGLPTCTTTVSKLSISGTRPRAEVGVWPVDR